jgi:hypothetical protein
VASEAKWTTGAGGWHENKVWESDLRVLTSAFPVDMLSEARKCERGSKSVGATKPKRWASWPSRVGDASRKAISSGL